MKYPLLLISGLRLWKSGGFAQSRPATALPKRSTVTVSGYIREAGSQEALVGVNAYLAADGPGARPIGSTSNTYGFYSLTLPTADSVALTFSFMGYTTTGRTVSLRNSQTLTIDLVPGRALSEVVVTLTVLHLPGRYQYRPTFRAAWAALPPITKPRFC